LVYFFIFKKIKVRQMQIKRKNYIGIDVSKLSFDVSLLWTNGLKKSKLLYKRFENTTKGIKVFALWLKDNKVASSSQTLVVLENTGIYHRLIFQFACEQQMNVHVGNAAEMRWSFGIARGKSDIIDSKRICEYAYQKEENILKTPAITTTILGLHDLMVLRNKLIEDKKNIAMHLNELAGFNDKATQKMLEASTSQAIKGLEASIKKIEENIEQIIKSNESLKKNYSLLNSVPGIGPWIALALIVYTANFANNPTGKQLASYAGVVPFERTSGTSIKGKPKVHPMANKNLKGILHMGAMAAKKHYPEFKDYYERKIEEGKHPMQVLNAIKNKLVLRCVSVIKNQRAYVDNIKAEIEESVKNIANNCLVES
jgi:transposase